jgi:transglutaminase-like putative cysteine protease
VFTVSNGLIFAQSAPVKWGEIPKADLEMKNFSADTSAQAMILCDYGFSHFNDDLEIEYERLLRVKIFTKQGYEWGTHSIFIYDKKGAEKVRDIEAVTYILNQKGEIEKHKLNDDDIFKEEISENNIKYSFTMPDLQPGCIVEIKYKIIADNPFYMKDWTFQHSIPVRWSEYCIRTPKRITYAIVTLGYEPYEVKDVEETTQMFRSAAASYLHSDVTPCWLYRWAAKNLPALKDEPFITTKDNYLNRIQVQLSGYALGDGAWTQVLSTWDLLLKELLDDERIIGAIDVTGDVKKLTADITRGVSSQFDKMVAVYNWVRNSIVWTGQERITAKKDVDDVIEDKKGSNAEIAVLLLSMLKSCGIQGEPIILSTRSNGKIQNSYPIASQFNYLTARVNIDNKYYILDATDPLRPYDLLPEELLNVTALVIKPGKPEWIVINDPVKSEKKSITTVNLSADGTITGNLEESLSRYEALHFRKNISDKSDIQIVKDYYNSDDNSIKIDSVVIKNRKNPDEPLIIDAWFKADNYAQLNNDYVYINPFLVNRRKNNPYKSDVRNFPVDYAFKSTTTNVINLTFPHELALKDTLNKARLAVDKYLDYSLNTNCLDNKIQIVSNFSVNEVEMPPKIYARIKNFYSGMIDLQAAILAFSKNNSVNLNSAEVKGK